MLIMDLMAAVVSQVVQRGGYVTKTKLLKLLYLFDLEYYRVHRQTFTGFNWKFFHLGPWAREFDPLVDDLVVNDILLEGKSANQEHDTTFYRTAEPRDATRLFARPSDELLLRGVLSTWADAPTSEILDHVYFHTEPMLRGVRNEPLDFSCISVDAPEKYQRPPSSVTEQELKRRRLEFQSKLARHKRDSVDFHFTPPRYDEEFQKALEKIEDADR